MNRTNSKFSVKNLVLGALFLALALVLPFFTGQIPQIGTMLCPMHLPILLAGFVCGGPVGAVVGFIAPLLRMVMFGMPPFYVAIAMAFELLTYGLVSGIMYRKVFKKQTVGTLYGSLLTAMVAGRGVEPDKAMETVTQHDKGRANYYRTYCEDNWADLHSYDMTMNSSTCGLEGTVDLLVDAIKDRFGLNK